MEDHATLAANLRNDARDMRADMNKGFADVRADMTALRAEMRSDRHWIVGLLLTSVIAIGSAVIGLYFK